MRVGFELYVRKIGFRFLTGATKLCLLQCVRTGFGVRTPCYLAATGIPYCIIKAAVCVGVKNAWSCTSSPQHAVMLWWFTKHCHKLTVLWGTKVCFVNNALSRLLSHRPAKFFIRCMTAGFVEFHSTQSVLGAKILRVKKKRLIRTS